MKEHSLTIEEPVKLVVKLFVSWQSLRRVYALKKTSKRQVKLAYVGVMCLCSNLDESLEKSSRLWGPHTPLCLYKKDCDDHPLNKH